jgi:hypothetical protein
MLRDKKFFWSSFQLRATLYLSFFLSFLSSFASHLISSHLILSYPILSYPSIYLSIYLTWCYVIKTSIELMIRHKKSSCSSTTASSYVVYIYIHTYITWCYVVRTSPVLLLQLQATLYTYMGHCQFLVYSSKSSIWSGVLSFFGFGEYNTCYQLLSFFEECIIAFQAPAQFPKNRDGSNTTFHYAKFWL